MYMYGMSWYLYQMVTQKQKQSMLFDLFKAFDQIQSSHKSDIFYSKKTNFISSRATCCRLLSDISTMYVSSMGMQNTEICVLHSAYLTFNPIFQNKKYVQEKLSVEAMQLNENVCPRSLDPFYTVSFLIKWAKTSWAYSK